MPADHSVRRTFFCLRIQYFKFIEKQLGRFGKLLIFTPDQTDRRKELRFKRTEAQHGLCAGIDQVVERQRITDPFSDEQRGIENEIVCGDNIEPVEIFLQSFRHFICRALTRIVQEKMKRADVVAFATPIYFYEISGQLKTFLDRTNPLYTADYAFRDIYLLTSAAEDGDDVWCCAACAIEGWIECFPKTHLCGVIFGGGVGAPGSIADHPAMLKAYNAGKAI